LPTEADLATMLNVSTVTLREALSELRKLGLVRTRRGRGGGSFVRSRDDVLSQLADDRLAELGTADLRELGDVHLAVASAAARLAASRASRTEIARLRSIVDRLAEADSVTGQRRTEGRYYIELAACAQSVRLTMQEMDLHLELGQLPWPPAHAPELLGVIVTGHRAVVDAIERRDPARAGSLTEEHIEMRTRWSVELRLRQVQGDASAVPQREVS
ncbi:MAG TPA: FCD domain-containing protein, partial [Pseudonocardia sp.]|nr:FCD domain-containing protein [Pseudonocardia sp.]